MDRPWSLLRRPYPNANVVLLHGPRPVLVDTGHAGDVAALFAWLRDEGVAPDSLALVVNTHHHSDHVGGNPALQALGVPLATGAAEAEAINRRDPEACDSAWLRQPVHPYRIDRALAPDEVIDTGAVRWRVIPTPAHSPGHVSLFAPDPGLLVAGDLFHGDDTGWPPPPSRLPDALGLAEASLARVAALAPRAAVSGHGAPIDDPAAAIAAARDRVARWRAAPDRAAWHAAKRIFAHALIVSGGMTRAQAEDELRAAPWLAAYAADWLGAPVDALIPVLFEQLVRAGASWSGDRLMATAATVPLAPGWEAGAAYPSDWPDSHSPASSSFAPSAAR